MASNATLPLDDLGLTSGPVVRGTAGFYVTFACTAVAYAIHKTKRVHDDQTRLREDLWGLRLEPFSFARRFLLTLLAGGGLLALFVHTWRLLGTHATIIVASAVFVVLRSAGIFTLLRRRALRAMGRSRTPLPRLGDPGRPLPVWVLTGFLGSGKTTLVNRLLREKAMRMVVIENEIGDTRLDAELVVDASGQAQSVLLVNGDCGCCKVRGDLCDLLRDEVLGHRLGRDGIEGCIIECSGLADPAAVVHTFLLDEDLKRRLELREVIAVVDALHVGRHLFGFRARGAEEAKPLQRLVQEQIAFASLVLLNKVDRAVGPHGAATLERLEEEIVAVNSTAEILRCAYCDVDLDRILGGGGDGRCAEAGFRSAGAWAPDRALVDIESIRLEVSSTSSSVSGGRKAEDEESRNGHSSTKDKDARVQDLADIRCISVRVDGDLNLDAFNRWVLRTLKDFDVLRAKGVLAAAGYREKLAFQAVHAAFDGTPSLRSQWKPGEPRHSEIVLIGCDIPVDLIEIGLRRCSLKT